MAAVPVVKKRTRSFSSFPSISFSLPAAQHGKGHRAGRRRKPDAGPARTRGSEPRLVDETANIPDAAKKIVWGTMAWGGQWCTSPGYAYVHESVAERFVAEAKAALIALYGKDPKIQSKLFARHQRTRSHRA